MSGSYTEMDVSKIFTALFLLTEVYSAHGSCNATEGFPNARSVRSMEGQAHFDDGFQIKYRCDDGFTLVSSDGTSTCQNGRWTSVECIQGCNEIPNADIYIVDKDGVMGKEPVTFVKHGQQVSIQCKEHFTLYKDGAFYDTDGTSSTCAVGSWSPAYSCKKDSCCLQVPDNGYLEINGARREDAIRIDSGFEGSIVCEEGFAFLDNDRQEFFEHFPVTCFGHILNASIPKCVKVTHYELEVKVGNSQLAGSRGQLYVTMLSEQGGIIHKMAFEKPVFKGLFPGQLYTLNSFTSGQNGKVWIIKLQLRHEQGINAFLEIDHIRLTIQHAEDNIKEEYDFSSVGRLNNNQAKLVRPDEPCTLPAIEHTRDNEIPKELANNKQVRVECKNGYEMMGSDIANQNIKTNCNKGNLAPSLDNIKCIPKGCSGTSNANVYRTTASGNREEEPASSFDHEEYAIVKCHDQYVLSQDSKPVRDRESKPTRCMFGRWEPEYTCRTDESVYSDYAYAYEVESDESFYDYPGVDEVKPEKTCPNPANGRLVRSYLSYYNVVCDDGYELDVVENDDDYKCSNGKWMSKNFGFEAECNEKTHYGLEVKVGNSLWAGSWGELYVSILSEQGEIIHRMAFEKPDFKGLHPGHLYTLGSSTTGETRKVGHLRLLLGPSNRGIDDNLEIDHIRLTIQRDADNTKKEYDFSSVGFLHKNQKKLVRPDTAVFRLKYRLGDEYYAGSRDTLHISFEGNLGHTPFYLMSSGRRNKGQPFYKVIDGEYVGQIHTVTIVNQKVNMVPNDIQIDYIELTVSHEDKEEKYIFRNVGWIGSRKEIQPEITADQPEMPSCQDDFDVSPGWVGTKLPHSEFTQAEYVKSDEECKNLCRSDGNCKVAAVSGYVHTKNLLCKLVYTNQKSAFQFDGNGSTHRLYTRKC